MVNIDDQDLTDVLDAESITEEDLANAFERFHDAFSGPPVEGQMLAWGTIADIIEASTYAGDLAEETRDLDNADSGSFGSLWQAGKFDPADPTHFAMGVAFLEQHQKF